MSGNAVFVLGIAGIAAVSLFNLNAMSQSGGCMDCASGQGYVNAKKLNLGTAIVTGALGTIASMFLAQMLEIPSSVDKTVVIVLLGSAALSWWSLGVIDQDCSCMDPKDVKVMKSLNSIVGSISTIIILIPITVLMFPSLKTGNSVVSKFFSSFPNLIQ